MYIDNEFSKMVSRLSTICQSKEMKVEYISQSIDMFDNQEINKSPELIHTELEEQNEERITIMNNHLEQRKLQLEQELEEVNRQLVNQSKLDETLEVVAAKLRKLQEILPGLSFEIHHNPYNNTLSIREYALHNGLKYYNHDIDYNNVKESLTIFDDMLNNPDKYTERYKIITRLVSKIKIEDAYVASGSVVYFNKEVVPTDSNGHAYQIAEARCVFTEDNYLNVKFHVMYEQIDDISENYEVVLDGFKFKVHVQLEDLDSLDFTNDYECKLENVNPKDLPSIIKKLKNATCNHNAIINFKDVVSGY